MDSLRFAHQFFHFSPVSWERHWQGKSPSAEEIGRLFRDDVFPLRTLKRGPVRGLQEAREEFERVLRAEAAAGVRAVPFHSPLYPPAVALYVPPERRPPFLYLRGPSFPDERGAVAIVGTRHPSALGREAAADFSTYFSTLGLRVVSGLARGIDAVAHQENLRLGTVAVLGSDVIDVYPRENEALAGEILARGGSLLSPFPFGQVPFPHNFPQRNEIIAALSTGVVVVEGNETSGAAVTGKLALAMGKPVVVLAQDYRTGFGRGAIRLQQSGAVFAASENEAIEALFSRWGGIEPTSSPSPWKARKRPFSFQDFLRASGVDAGAAIVLLEEGLASGRIEKVGPERYRLR